MVEGGMDERLRKLRDKERQKSSSKRRWRTHEGASDKILIIVKSNKNLTTNAIIKLLAEQNFKVTWKLVDSRLCELEEEGKIKRIQIGDAHKINFWNAI